MIKKIFPVIFLTLSILIFLYVFFKSEIYFESQNREYYSKYYIFSLLIIFLAIIIFFSSDKIKYYFFSISITFLVTCFLLEFYLTFLTKGNHIETRAKIYEKTKCVI